MKPKIIPFPHHFTKKPQPPLSIKMIITLMDACAKQKKGIPFGPKNLKGSCTTLITRGLIVMKDFYTVDEPMPTWRVTAEALDMLRAQGFTVAC